MNSDPNKPNRPNRSKLTSHELVAIDALLCESVGGETPPELKEAILQQYHQDLPVDDTTNDDTTNVAFAPVSRSERSGERSGERRRTPRRNWAILGGIAIAGSLAAFIWTRPSGPSSEGFAVAKSDIAESQATAKSNPTVVGDSQQADLLGDQVPGQKKPARSAIVLNEPTETDRVTDEKKQTKQQQRPRTSPASVKLVSKTIEDDFRSYWKSSGVRPTAQADAPAVAKRLSMALGVNVPPQVLADHDAVVDWLSNKKIGLAIARTWWGQVTGGNFAALPKDAQTRLQSDFARQLASTQYFDQYMVRLIGNTNVASNDFYAAMVPAASDATHPDMIANLASLTMNVHVSCTRCHDSMIGGNHGQQDYWGFAAAIDRGLEKIDNELVRVKDKPAKAVFYETMDRRGRVAPPLVPSRWLASDSSQSTSELMIESIPDWSMSLLGSPALAEGIVNSLWKLVHGRPLCGQAAHPMSAPMSDELVKVQQNLVDDLVNSNFNIQRTLAIILMSPTTRRSTPESLRDVWATDQSESHQKAIAFASALPPKVTVPMAVKVDQSMRAIGSVLSASDRNLLAQVGDGGKPANYSKGAAPLAWDFPDQADGPPVQWLQTVRKIDAKIAHLCYLGGLDEVPVPIRNAADAMQKAGVDEPTLLHRVWWMAQGN